MKTVTVEMEPTSREIRRADLLLRRQILGGRTALKMQLLRASRKWGPHR